MYFRNYHGMVVLGAIVNFPTLHLACEVTQSVIFLIEI